MTKAKNGFQFIGIVLVGMIGVIIGALLFTNIFSAIGIMDSTLGKILLTWGSMLIGFGVIPTYILRKRYLISKLDVGIGKIAVNEMYVCMIIVGITILYIVIYRNITSMMLFTIAILQNIGVAIFEEYFSKGILFFVCNKITSKKVIILLVSSCVFAFVLHGNDVFITNLLYRFPMAMILGMCYFKTNNLYLPITLHLVNNLLATSLLK